ncbi:MAG: cation acetate symporter [Myxococcota bacterium]|nr:cation acetate symporter [Deltaproteobacteria bacterium]MCP4245250.1 cation acetate symporter [bacterium]MDP6073988.1 cation acetate symporter [Myxococcota bacterium]MDP6241827.1 cation acetate symporter [Myxococcota bacterium]MDP7074540.1 cation acetate symporter [Myxococcota bacterium]
MDLQTLTYVIVGGSFLLYIAIAFLSQARTTGEFYVAGKHVHPVANGMATAADWMSAASFISMAGLIAFLGYDGTVYLMGWTGGYVLLALLLAPYLRKFGKFTVPEFIGDRYASQAARVVAVVCLILISFTYVAGQMRGVGIVFSRFLYVDISVGLMIGMAIVFFYAVLGGMKGITYTQVAQYCVLIFAYTVPAVFISLQVTGTPIPQIAFGSTVVGDGGFLLEKLDRIVTELGFAAYTSGSKSRADVFFIALSLMIGTAGLPHVIVRFFTVPRVRDARWSAGWALLFIALLYTTAPAVAALARLNLTETIQPGPVSSPEGNLAYENRPPWFETWEDTGLLRFEDKNGDGRIQYYQDANEAFAATARSYGWNGNELQVDRDIIVLANPEIAGLPNWVVALVAAGGIAAALSTAAGLLLVISAAVSHDLLKSVFAPKISERSELRAGRISVAIAVLLAGYLGYNPPGFVAQVVALAFGLAAASLFPVILLGIFTFRVNKQGAIAGMVSGLTFTVGYIVYFKGVFVEPFAENIPENWLFGISPEGIGALGAALNFAVALGVSAITRPPSAEVRALVERLRVPS